MWVCSAVRAQAGGKCIRRRQSALSDLDIIVIEDRSRSMSKQREQLEGYGVVEVFRFSLDLVHVVNTLWVIEGDFLPCSAGTI